MTKSIVITYQEADESFLMTFFKRFGIKTKAVIHEVDHEDGVPQRVADEIVAGLSTIKQYERGEIVLDDAYDLLRELREEAATA
jgi:nitrogenase molybdenum-iron protein alpha/beta subunit